MAVLIIGAGLVGSQIARLLIEPNFATFGPGGQTLEFTNKDYQQAFEDMNPRVSHLPRLAP